MPLPRLNSLASELVFGTLIEVDHLPAKANSGESGRVERIPESPRYRRIRFIARLMDQSILLPNGYRIGLDPLLGLLPGIGDLIGALISCYLVYESARLGLPKRVLLRMLGNILAEALAGSIPILGDIFDAAWKANMRNLQLLNVHYSPAKAERPPKQIGVWLIVVLAALIAGIAGFIFLVMSLVFSLIQRIAGS